MSKIKVGIITMHRVQNSGSALQAYALFRAIHNMGYECEIIDYKYPNEYHLDSKRESHITIKSIIDRIRFNLLYRNRIQRRRFDDFLKSYVKLSETYVNREQIMSQPPLYDIYVAGSDQIWNPRHMKGDSVFFCEFVNNKPKISYASSFSILSLPEAHKEAYKGYLAKFNSISVRESGGRDIVMDLLDKPAEVVCDPTLLLDRDAYVNMIPFIPKRKPYVLAYILDYAFNPYPRINEVISNISRMLNMEVIYLAANTITNYHLGRTITSAGPLEFISLFNDAEFIVTSSFHGTAFALNLNKPFYSIVPSNNDDRILTLLKQVGAEDRAIRADDSNPIEYRLRMDYNYINTRLDNYRAQSLNYLERALKVARSNE